MSMVLLIRVLAEEEEEEEVVAAVVVVQAEVEQVVTGAQVLEEGQCLSIDIPSSPRTLP
jgi:hypothetical protein